jgi:AAA ATPase domain
MSCDLASALGQLRYAGQSHHNICRKVRLPPLVAIGFAQWFGGSLMHLRSYRIQNYRRLRDVHIEFAKDISIFVGANNSAKTSATQAIEMFLSGRKEQFSLFDFSSHTWKLLNAVGTGDPEGDATATIPSIILDLWFEVAEADLYLVIDILPSSAGGVQEVGIRVEFCARNVTELLQRYRETKTEAQNEAAVLGEGVGDYVPWPKTLTNFLVA